MIYHKCINKIITIFKDVVITGSPDTTIRVWNVGAPNPLSQIIRAHEGAVTGVSLHPTGDYVLSTSADQNWAFSDIRTGKLLTKVRKYLQNKINSIILIFVN